TSVPFPFGLEQGCSANTKFQLNCTSNQTLIGSPPMQLKVTNISVDEGLVYLDRADDRTSRYYKTNEDEILGYTFMGDTDFNYSEVFGVWKWSVSNISCETAKRNAAAYACISDHSECLPVSQGNVYFGYRCKCSSGYEGNPYTRPGCTDIDECLRPNFCNGTCHNTQGNYRCIGCPYGTYFDHVEKKCIPTQTHERHNIALGIVIGLTIGTGVLALALILTILVRRWKRGIQKKIRRAYFRKNKGLLLEQLISSDESVAHSTKIFSLEELEKATDNFNSTRILGRGGHGTVYKGILSDQRVVAIKRSKIVEQGEIDQFVN
ncbi:hypothetical protein E2562_031702, partial [Oryza meyeriana var. granulata]